MVINETANLSNMLGQSFDPTPDTFSLVSVFWAAFWVKTEKKNSPSPKKGYVFAFPHTKTLMQFKSQT